MNDQAIDLLVTLGSCLTKVYGRYGGKRFYPNLFLFITAQASAGKGNLVYCRQLVNLIHEALREQTLLLKREYKIGMRQYSLMKWKEAAVEKPDKPPQKMLFIPANNSASGILQLIISMPWAGSSFPFTNFLANIWTLNFQSPPCSTSSSMCSSPNSRRNI